MKNERSSSNDSCNGFYQELSCRFQRCLLGELYWFVYSDPWQCHSITVSTSTKRKLQLQTFFPDVFTLHPASPLCLILIHSPGVYNKLLIVWCKFNVPTFFSPREMERRREQALLSPSLLFFFLFVKQTSQGSPMKKFTCLKLFPLP